MIKEHYSARGYSSQNFSPVKRSFVTIHFAGFHVQIFVQGMNKARSTRGDNFKRFRRFVCLHHLTNL